MRPRLNPNFAHGDLVALVGAFRLYLGVMADQQLLGRRIICLVVCEVVRRACSSKSPKLVIASLAILDLLLSEKHRGPNVHAVLNSTFLEHRPIEMQRLLSFAFKAFIIMGFFTSIPSAQAFATNTACC